MCVVQCHTGPAIGKKCIRRSSTYAEYIDILRITHTKNTRLIRTFDNIPAQHRQHLFTFSREYPYTLNVPLVGRMLSSRQSHSSHPEKSTTRTNPTPYLGQGFPAFPCTHTHNTHTYPHGRTHCAHSALFHAFYLRMHDIVNIRSNHWPDEFSPERNLCSYCCSINSCGRAYTTPKMTCFGFVGLC